MDILSALVPIVYIVVGIALIWLLVELIRMIRSMGAIAQDTQRQIEPIIEKTDSMLGDLEPVVKKVEPMVDRLALTVDAANLEIMRVDQILEDVSVVTHSLNSTASAMEELASAPVAVANGITNKVSSLFGGKQASDKSVALGEAKGEQSSKAIGDGSEGFAVKAKDKGAVRAVKRYYESKVDAGR